MPSYGAAGIAHSTVFNPAAPELCSGQEFTAALTHDLAGRQTGKTLTQGDHVPFSSVHGPLRAWSDDQ
ncbi:hypothetical protein [Streptomyces sp. NRRL F-2664]|uniref:hypothetical protein n=1 Tax=Streptomyces sp. NRRL F-2664 TaxID=1463842 RepID=UPI0004C816E9|nr:hypothetical protein [Streptomyces sp. NRRL F-2664]